MGMLQSIPAAGNIWPQWVGSEFTGWDRVPKELNQEVPFGFTLMQRVLRSYHLFTHSASILWSWPCARNHPSSWGPSIDGDRPSSCGVLLGHFSYGLPVMHCSDSWTCQEESSIPKMRYWTYSPPINISFSPSPFCPTHPSVPTRSL